jgi:hypothetical protein
MAALAPAAHAVTLLATGSLPGTLSDLSSATAAPLENGVAGNLLGGLGSGIAWAGGSTFIATPDRGPNATPYNALVDDTASYIDRFQTLDLSLTASSAGSALPYTLTPTLSATTLLSSATPLTYGTGALGTGGGLTLGSGVPALNAVNNTYYFTGRSDGFAPGVSTNPNNARFDPEGVRVSNDGKSLFVSDEYGPYVYQFDRATGQRINAFALPANLAVAVPGPTTTSEGAPTNTLGRVANKGMEGLALTPDGKTLVGIMQAPLLQDASGKTVRIVTIDIATGATKQFGYTLTSGSGVSEIVAINNHEFLVDERDGKGLGDGSSAAAKTFYRIDLAGATDISGLPAGASLAGSAVGKTQVVDLVALLKTQAGLSAADIPAKIEGLAFGQDVMVNGKLMHTLIVASDNDFLASVGGKATPNNFYVLGLTDDELPGFLGQPIAAVPEPATVVSMLSGLALLGFVVRRRQR